MSKWKQFWKKWKAFGRKAGDIFGRIVMTVFYYTLAAPFGFGVRLFSDPLKLKKAQEPGWESRQSQEDSLEKAKEPF
ncbi:MAG: hypothetical protein WCC06_06170 [Candidatus Aminicenantales bacterium]